MQKVIFGIVLICFSLVGLSQNTRNVTTPQAPKPQYQSAKKEKKGLFSFLKKKESKKYEVEKFRDRLSDVYKQKAKEERRSDKPQYTNPAYFGHKKEPKKRKPGKQKFCKTCGIKH